MYALEYWDRTNEQPVGKFIGMYESENRAYTTLHYLWVSFPEQYQHFSSFVITPVSLITLEEVKAYHQ